MERKELLDALRQHHAHLCARESLTGGSFSAAFTSIPGASNVFNGSAITYVDAVKEKFGVKTDTIEKYGAISQECAKERALSASLFFNAECAVSFTGNAGPSASENKPVGLVYIGVKVYNKLKVFELHLEGDRDSIRRQCVDFGFSQRKKRLDETSLEKTMESKPI